MLQIVLRKEFFKSTLIDNCVRCIHLLQIYEVRKGQALCVLNKISKTKFIFMPMSLLFFLLLTHKGKTSYCKTVCPIRVFA